LVTEILLTLEQEYLLQENDFIAASANLVAFCYHEFKNINWLGFYFVKNNNMF